MKNHIDRYLVLKYPKLFVNRYSSIKTTAMSWGFDVDDGWFWLIDNLCNSIQSYTDNNSKRWRIKNKITRAFFEVFKHQRLYSKFKFIRHFLHILYEKSEKEEYESICQVTVDQVKEKFGGLRFYYSGGDDIIHGMVWLAESMSYDICEICGSTENIGKTKGWIKVICEDCSKIPNNRGVSYQWKKYEEDPKFLRKVKLDILNNSNF